MKNVLEYVAKNSTKVLIPLFLSLIILWLAVKIDLMRCNSISISKSNKRISIDK